MKKKNALLNFPIWVLEIFTEAKSFEKNPVLGSLLLNRLGLHVVRVLFAHGLTGFRRFLLGFRVPRELRAEFRAQGFVQINNALPDEHFQKLKSEALGPWPQTRYFIQGDTTTDFLYLDENHRRELPASEQLSQISSLNKLMHYVAASALQPWLDFLKITNQSGISESDPQKTFHSDTFHPTMKAWLFLEDISSDKGPFEYIVGSNRLTWSRLKWEYSCSLKSANLDQTYARRGSLRVSRDEAFAMGYGETRSFTVSENTFVIADTYGFHRRGEADANSSRLSMAWSLRTNPFFLLPAPNWHFLNRFVEKQVNKHYEATSLLREK